MLKKIVSGLLMLLVMNIATVAFASGNAEKEAKFTEKVKNEIARLGVGIDAKVKVKLKDGTKLKGYISEANNEQFVVVDSNGKAASVPYPQAKQVKGNNLSTGAKIAIGIGIAVVALLILGYVLGGTE
jgi:hypothetical protein